MQVDGSLGLTAAISEMLIQSHEDVIQLLPAIPKEWGSGEFRGVCARGAFELDLNWEDGVISTLEILSKAGVDCKINVSNLVNVVAGGIKVPFEKGDGYIKFPTEVGMVYCLEL